MYGEQTEVVELMVMGKTQNVAEETYMLLFQFVTQKP